MSSHIEQAEIFDKPSGPPRCVNLGRYFAVTADANLASVDETQKNLIAPIPEDQLSQRVQFQEEIGLIPQKATPM